MPKRRPTTGHLFKSNTSLVSSPGSTVTGAHARASQLWATRYCSRQLCVPDHLFLLDIETQQHTTGFILNTFWFFRPVVDFFFLLRRFVFFLLLFTWATGTKILFNTLFIARNFWWRLFRRPSLQISQRGVLAVFLFGVGTVGGNKSTLRPQLQAPWPVWQLELWVVFPMMINIKKYMNTWKKVG